MSNGRGLTYQNAIHLTRSCEQTSKPTCLLHAFLLSFTDLLLLLLLLFYFHHNHNHHFSMNSWLFKYRFFSLNLLGTPSKFTNVPVFLIADLHNIPYIISRYIPCGLVGACCVPRYHDTSNICVATLSVYVRARYKQLYTVKIEIDVATLSAQLYARCVPCYMKVVWQHCQYTYTHSAVLQRETRKCCGNTVSTHIRTLPCYIVKQESVVATLSVHIYELCRATSWNKKVLWKHW